MHREGMEGMLLQDQKDCKICRSGVEESALPLRHQKERTFALSEMMAELKTPPKESYATSGMHVEQIHNKNVDSTWTTVKITVYFL